LVIVGDDETGGVVYQRQPDGQGDDGLDVLVPALAPWRQVFHIAGET
jgi:hypothetical protein